MRIKIFAQLLLLIFAVSSASFSQKNPYKEIGKKGEVLTLSNGKYEEFFDDEDVQQIGTTLVNIRTNKIVKLLSQEDADKRLDNTIGKRFLSVDPLTSKYPELTPYQFSSNSPIANVDVDGQESYWYQFNIDKKTGEVTFKLMAVKKSWLDWITPSHLVVKIGDRDWVYDADYCKSCGTLDKQLQKIKSDPEAYYTEMQEMHNEHDKYIARGKAADKEMEDMMWAMAFGMKYSQSKAATAAVATEEQAVAANNKVSPNGQKVSTSAANSPAAAQTSSEKAATVSPKPAAGAQAKLLLKPSTSLSTMVEHHIFNVFRGSSPGSQKYRDFFKNLGIKVNDHVVKIPEELHKHLHREGNNWTTRWKRWIDEHPNATAKDVYQQAGKMMDDAGINSQPIKKYQK